MSLDLQLSTINTHSIGTFFNYDVLEPFILFLFIFYLFVLFAISSSQLSIYFQSQGVLDTTLCDKICQ